MIGKMIDIVIKQKVRYADYYLSSASAITEDGQIVSIIKYLYNENDKTKYIILKSIGWM